MAPRARAPSSYTWTQVQNVKELIQRFDSDGDGKLSGDEVSQLNDALLRKRRQVDMQLAAQLSPRSRARVAGIFKQHDDDGQHVTE